MKSKEFIAERTWYDKWMDQYVDSGEVTQDSLILAEAFDGDIKQKEAVDSFIQLHTANSMTPVEGDEYYPVGFVLNGALKRLQILNSEDKVTLIKINSPREFEVLINGVTHATFPCKFIGNLAAGATFFYGSLAEAQHMTSTISYAMLSPEWDLEQIVITLNGERIIK